MKKTLIVITVVVILIVAGISLWGGKTPVSTSGTSQAAAVSMASSSSDAVSDIDAELNVTDPGPDLSSLN